MPIWSTPRALGLLLLVMACSASPARAGVLWYNGDYDNRASLTNETQVPINTGSGYAIQNSLVYDNFTVPNGQTWTLTSVFSNDQIAYVIPPTMATWQIRTGVSSGNGGTLVAGGDTAATETALPQTPGYSYNDPAYQITAVVPSVVLKPGTYWLAVSPDDITGGSGNYGDQSYIMTTSGANSVGTPPGNDGNSFISNTYPPSGSASYNFTPTTSVLNGRSGSIGSHIDFSMGVNGTSVPEPSSVALVAVGLIGTLAWSRRRRSAPAL